MEKKFDFSKLKDKTLAVLCFDMQSVLQSNISKIYYKTKLPVYNVTVYNLGSKQSYCMIWNESIGGRKGTIIASALILMLDELVTENSIKKIILWSDVYMSQNKKAHGSSVNLLYENSPDSYRNCS